MPIPKAKEVRLSDTERQGLEKLFERHQTGQQIAMRARIVIAAAGRLKNKEIVQMYQVCRHSQAVAQSFGMLYSLPIEIG